MSITVQLVTDRGVRARRLDGLRGRELLRFAAIAALIVLGVSGLAVTQPMLDLVGSNAEFFVAGNYSTTQIVTFALVIALLPPLVGILVVVSAAFVDRRAGSVALAGVTAVFAAGLVLAVLRSLGVDALWLVAAVGDRVGADRGLARLAVPGRPTVRCLSVGGEPAVRRHVSVPQ